MNETFNVCLLAVVRGFGVDYKFWGSRKGRERELTWMDEMKGMLDVVDRDGGCMIAYSIAVGPKSRRRAV